MISIEIILISVLIPLLHCIRLTEECPALPPRNTTPIDVHDLRIDDIKVIAGIGDSIITGLYAKGFEDPEHPLKLSTFYEHHGVSWAMGGDPGAATLANFIARYSPKLVGASIKSHLANLCYGPICPPFQYRPELDQLNAARTGALISNMKSEAKWLIGQMNSRADVDMKNDYKLLTMSVGSNDICLGCLPILKQTLLTGDHFEKSIREVIEHLRTNIPRLVINIFQQFNVSRIYNSTDSDEHCRNIRKLGVALECTCAFQGGDLGEKARIMMDDLTSEYNSRILKIERSYSQTKDPSFKLIVDPLFSGVDLGKWSIDSFSKIDCFHPTVKTHELMASGAWNNLFFPYEQKHIAVNNTIHLLCPTAEHRIQ